MKRLTQKTEQGNILPLKNAVCGIDMPHWCLQQENDNEWFLTGDAVDKLAEYEELEEQGRLIKLPCKVGDRVYPLSCYGYEQGHKIISVNYYAEAGIQSCEFEIESDDHGDYDTFELDDIGIRVFFNKDERDRKLDEDIQKEVEAFERVQEEVEAVLKT